MRTVPTTWIEGPNATVCVHKVSPVGAPLEYAVKNPNAPSDVDPVLHRNPNRKRAVEWAQEYAGSPHKVTTV